MRGKSVAFLLLSVLCAAASTRGFEFEMAAEDGVAPNPAEFIADSRLPLRTSGTVIVDNAGDVVKLACVNWYHAHMDTFVVSGLHLQPLANLTARLVELGFNCVRLPFSLEAVLSNPVVPARFLAANPEFVGLRAMEMMDVYIEEWANQGLLVVLNNHNSKAGWCCAIDSEEGIWATEEYPAKLWVEGLANITRRYASEPRVVAVDMRNEIHDVGEKLITWGTSDDISTDWRVAAETAGNRILDEDPDMLVIVSGLCFGYDLRLLHENPPDLNIDNRLVWTIHTYANAMWWNLVVSVGMIPWEALTTLFFFAFFASLLMIGLAVGREDSRAALRAADPVVVMSVACAWSFGISSVFFVGGFIWHEAMRQAGCVILSEGRTMSGVAGAVMFVAATAAFLGSRWRKRHPWGGDGDDLLSAFPEVSKAADDVRVQARCAGPSCCQGCSPGCTAANRLLGGSFLFLLTVPLIFLGLNVDSPGLLAFELDHKWGLAQSEHPIWVGEFGDNSLDIMNEEGTSVAPQNVWFENFIEYLDSTQLSWAYWPFDGLRWYEERDDFGAEPLGILQPDYDTVRSTYYLGGLQAVQALRLD